MSDKKELEKAVTSFTEAKKDAEDAVKKAAERSATNRREQAEKLSHPS